MENAPDFLNGFFWPIAAAAVMFFILAVVFLAAFCTVYQKEKRSRKEADAARDKAERLSLQIETLRAEIETVRAIREASFAPAPASPPEYPYTEPGDAPLLLDEVIDPRIFESTVDRNPSDGAADAPHHSYTVVYDGLKKDWTVRKYGTLRAIRRFAQKEDALRAAREFTQKLTAKK